MSAGHSSCHCRALALRENKQVHATINPTASALHMGQQREANEGLTGVS
jgi:hypothetical protein